MDIKGSLRFLILAILDREPSHGYRIRQTIHDLSNGVLHFTEGTLYPTLGKMREEGLIEEVPPVDGPSNRRYYQLTDEGRQLLVDERVAWKRFVLAVNTVVRAEPPPE